jgi:flagellar biosynthetic protein FliR
MTGIETLGGMAVLLVRPGLLVIGTPFLGGLHAPVPMRIGITVLLAIVLAPLVTLPAVVSASTLVAVLSREVAIGLALALGIRVLVFGAELAGHLSGYQLGLSMGALIDPQTGVRNTLLAVLYANVAILVMFATNAHHALIRALADSYAALPVGAGGVDASMVAGIAELLGLVFIIGVRIAAPVIVVLLIVELALGIVARVAPALNVMMSGAPLRLLVGLLVVAATVTAMPALITRYVPQVLSLAAETARAFR